MGIELTIVVENTAKDEVLVAEHGLAVHIAAGGRSFLFDTSATPEALATNAKALSIDLSAVEGVAISHGHLDHTGGMPALLAARPQLKVYAHPDVFIERYSHWPNQPRQQIGWQFSPVALCGKGAVFCPVRAAQELTDGVVLSGPIAGPQPAIDRFLVQGPDGLVGDEFVDESALMLRGSRGWSVLTGCCHRGLANTLRTARDLAGGEPIYAVLGGFHLGPAGEAELAAAADAIREVGPTVIYPCHCTGKPGCEYLAREFPGAVEQIHGGTRLSL